jgi:putative lipoic acid-binding regulatory protein
MILDENSPKPHIDYPCKWEYKIIGNNIDKILNAVENASMGLTYDVTPSNISKNDRYFSLNFTIEVANQVVRDLVYEKLNKDPNIILVL